MTAIRLIELGAALHEDPPTGRPSMTTPERTPVLSQLESALETSCATLVAVEALRAHAAVLAEELQGIQSQIGDTIASLREGIAQFRASQDSEASLLAFGFVLEPEYSRRAQVRPRRTA